MCSKQPLSKEFGSYPHCLLWLEAMTGFGLWQNAAGELWRERGDRRGPGGCDSSQPLVLRSKRLLFLSYRSFASKEEIVLTCLKIKHIQGSMYLLFHADCTFDILLLPDYILYCYSSNKIKTIELFEPFGSYLGCVFGSSLTSLILGRLFHHCVPQLSLIQENTFRKHHELLQGQSRCSLSCTLKYSHPSRQNKVARLKNFCPCYARTV